MIKRKIDLHSLIQVGTTSGGYFLTTIINQTLPLLILPIITSYLKPSEYGSLALFSFYLAISNAITGVSIPTVVSKYFYNSEKDYIAKIIGNSIIVAAVLSLTTILLILLAFPFLKSFIDLSLVWLLIIPTASFAFIVFSIGLTVMRNLKRAFDFGKSQILNTIINLSISLFLVITLMWGWQGRAWGIIISYIISAIISFYYLYKKGYIIFQGSNEIVKKILKVVFPLIPNSLQSVIISQVGIFFFQYYYTKELLGLYSIGFQIAVMVKLLTDTLNMSWSPFLFEQISGKKPINKIHITRLLWILIAILILGLLFINFTADFILKIMTTPEYYGAKQFILWFTIGFLFYGIYTFLFPILIKHEKQKYISTITFINVFVMILLNLWFINIFGYMGIAYAYCVTYFIMFLCLLGMAQKVMPLPWIKSLQIWK